MGKTTYCEKCKKEVEAYSERVNEVYEVYGEKIAVESDVLICPICKSKISYEENDSNTIKLAYKKYRNNHKLLTPEEIRQIREKYDLNQNEFSNLLGWGEKTIWRYENGSIQDKVHNDLLMILKNPYNMANYINEHKDSIPEKTRNKVLNSINNGNNHSKNIIDSVFNYEPSIYSGFKKFDYEKFCLMVAFFVDKSNNKLQKTKLFKLLNYSDCLYFKENCVSISGVKYVHFTYGPIPDRYGLLMDAMNTDDIIKERVLFDNQYETHQIIKGSKEFVSKLNAVELDVLNRVYDKFKDYTAKQISDASHKEEGYELTNAGDYISYEYANSIEI